MKKFNFSKSQHSQPPTFKGQVFYSVYKDSEFLRHSENIEMILSRGHELRKMLKNTAPGESVIVGDMQLNKNCPLLVKNTAGPNITVEDFEFTYNRLTGLTAAYAFENRQRFPALTASESVALGLHWDCNDIDKCRFYLSAVTGAEHFYEQFYFYPLVCALRKLQLNKITPEPVIKMANKKNNYGVKLAVDLKTNVIVATRLWSKFPGTSALNLKSYLATLPAPVKRALAED